MPTLLIGALLLAQTALQAAEHGVAEAKAGHYAAAITDYQRALALDPALPGLHLNLGLAYFKSGRFREAIAALQAEQQQNDSGQIQT